MNIILNGKEITFTTDQYNDLVDHVVKEQKRKKLESALAAREDDPVWKKVVTTLRAEDIYDMSEKFDNMVSDYTGEDEKEALLSMYKEVDKYQNKVEVERMKVKEAKDILELIRDNIEMPIPKVTRTGLAITALTGGIDALESVDALKKYRWHECTSSGR